MNVRTDRREKQRRLCKDRRAVVRFGDVLGRRSGDERRIGRLLNALKSVFFDSASK